MPSQNADVRILDINERGSDGDSSKRPTGDGYVQNNSYWLERIATDKWAKDLGLPCGSNIVYRLNKLPQGFAAFEKRRGNQSKHIDRYVYGHPRRVFRSMNEFYPHFKHLMDHGQASGCTCAACTHSTGTKSAQTTVAGSQSHAQHFGDRRPVQMKADRASIIQQQTRDVPPPRQRQVDAEQTPDVYRYLIDELEAAQPEGISEPIIERNSPDWRTGEQGLKEMLQSWAEMPSFIPRQGEVILFAKNLSDQHRICWDSTNKTFRVVTTEDGHHTWLKPPLWEAGIVTQMPVEPATYADLVSVPLDKTRALNQSGFRVQPLAQPNSVNKKEEKQHKYVPLHAIRPLSLWRECFPSVSEHELPSTIRHALTVTNTFNLVGRFYFKGIWPDATVFSRGLYIGHELLLVGDVVRLIPRSGEQTVTEILKITSIKLIFTDLNEATNDDYDDGPAYGVCLHLSGYKYTQDRTNKLDGSLKEAIPSDSDLLPQGILHLGPWYHSADVQSQTNKTEIPFVRALGRCYEIDAIRAWYDLPADLRPPTSFPVVNPTSPSSKGPLHVTAISHGLQGMMSARSYAKTHDSRIDGEREWFFADSRVEQLDIHEFNGERVGLADKTRKQMPEWRDALEMLDGSEAAINKYEQSANMRQQQIARSQSILAASSNSMVAGAASTVVVPIADEGDEDEDKMDGDEEEGEDGELMEAMEVDQPPVNSSSGSKEGHRDVDMDVDRVPHCAVQGIARPNSEAIDLDADSESELVAEQLANDMMQSMRQ